MFSLVAVVVVGYLLYKRNFKGLGILVASFLGLLVLMAVIGG